MARLLGPKWLSGYVFAWILGHLLALLLLALFLTGKVRVHGYWRLIKALWGKNCIVTPNHPEGATPFLIPALAYPWGLFLPWFFMWNMPRERLVPKWAMGALRCILVDRGSNAQKSQALRDVLHLLRGGGCILVFPEGTRTVDPTNKETNFIERGSRRIRRIKTAVPLMAASAGSMILPCYIDTTDPAGKLHFWASIWHIWRHRMTINFGRPYHVEKKYNLEEENLKLGEAILSS